MSSANGILAQLGEHLPYKQRGIGSSPIGPILQPKSCSADVAQLAEQLICNQQVVGSIPIASSTEFFAVRCLSDGVFSIISWRCVIWYILI